MTAVSDRLESLCRLDPAAPAIGAVGGPLLSRLDLSHRLARGRQALQFAGLGPADRVAVLPPVGLGGAIAVLQVLGTCSLAPLRPSLGAAGWEAALDDLRPSALVATDDWPEAAEAAGKLGIRVLDPAELLDGYPLLTPPTVGGRAELLLATSGSTGAPKWVRIDQRNMVTGSLNMTECMGLTPQDRSLLALPLDHAHGVASGLLLPLISGGSVVVADGFDPDLFIAAIRAHAITWFTVAPAMHRALLDQLASSPLHAGHSLRLVRSGTVILPPATMAAMRKAYGVPVIEAYGMTESPHITCNPTSAPRPGSVGQAVVEHLAVVDDDGRPVPPGQWGQVVLRGAPVMDGYLKPVGGIFRDGWFQTGDEGKLDDEGYLYLRGRFSERINRGGAMVAPADIDAALMTHPAVRQAVCFPVPHPTLGHDVAAAVVLATGSEIDETALRDYLARRVEPRQVPSRIIAIDAIPVGAAGKVSRGSLARALSDLLFEAFEPARDQVEQSVISVFEAVLADRLPTGMRLGRNSNFFLSGGDSLAAVRAASQLAQAGYGERTPALIFDNPTPSAIAQRLTENPAPAVGCHLVTLQSDGKGEPVFLVHGLSGQLFEFRFLAWSLGRKRTVHGVQAAGYTAEHLSKMSAEQLAAHYADDILERHPQGQINLVGYSAGGWYAYAVAAALLDKGAKIGALVLLDSPVMLFTQGCKQLPPALRAAVRLDLVLEIISRTELGGWLRNVALNRATQLGARLRKNFGLGTGSETTQQPFLDLVRDYRPARIPVTVDVFGPDWRMRRLRRGWSYYALGGVRCHPIFQSHTDFTNGDLAPALAAELERVFSEVSRGPAG